MALTKPTLAQVSPGQPLTAQGWNGVIDALSKLYDAVLSLGTGVLQVDVRSSGQPVLHATVVAVPRGEGAPVLAIPPHGDVTQYLLGQLTPGTWTVNVSAVGFSPASVDVQIPASAPVSVSLTEDSVPMPDLFGLSAADAIAALDKLNINVAKIIDVTGREVARRPLAPEYGDSAVLVQVPSAGELVDPKRDDVRLAVSVSLSREATVAMPSLVGLTLEEATKTLERLGLKLGKITTRGARPL